MIRTTLVALVLTACNASPPPVPEAHAAEPAPASDPACDCDELRKEVGQLILEREGLFRAYGDATAETSDALNSVSNPGDRRLYGEKDLNAQLDAAKNKLRKASQALTNSDQKIRALLGEHAPDLDAVWAEDHPSTP